MTQVVLGLAGLFALLTIGLRMSGNKNANNLGKDMTGIAIGDLPQYLADAYNYLQDASTTSQSKGDDGWQRRIQLMRSLTSYKANLTTYQYQGAVDQIHAGITPHDAATIAIFDAEAAGSSGNPVTSAYGPVSIITILILAFIILIAIKKLSGHLFE